MRPMWFQSKYGKHLLEKTYFLPHTWRSNIKAETRGTYTDKFLQQFCNSISYCLHFYIYFFLASQFAFRYSQHQSWRIWEKQIYKKQSEYYHCPYFYQKTAFCIGRQFPRNKLHLRRTFNDTSNIYPENVNHICK